MRRDYKHLCLLWKGKASDWLCIQEYASQRQGSSPASILYSRQRKHSLSHKGRGFWMMETLSLQCRHCFKEKSKKKKRILKKLPFCLFWLVPFRLLDDVSLELKAQMWLQKQNIFSFFFSLLSETNAFAYRSTCRETQSNTSNIHSKSETKGKSQTTGCLLKDHKFLYATLFL